MSVISSSESSFTSNGNEIEHSRNVLQLAELKEMLGAYGLEGGSPKERLDSLRNQSKESLALFMTDLNARLNGSEGSLVHEDAMKIGDKQTVAPEDRYDLFSSIVEKVRNCPEDVNPARVGDTLALTTVLLHPYKDANGRTARMFGYIFRDDIDGLDGQEDFNTLVEPRDQARERGGFTINGYIPYVGEGTDQSDPTVVSGYVDKLLASNDTSLYTSPYGQAELIKPPDNILQGGAE